MEIHLHLCPLLALRKGGNQRPPPRNGEIIQELLHFLGVNLEIIFLSFIFLQDPALSICVCLFVV